MFNNGVTRVKRSFMQIRNEKGGHLKSIPTCGQCLAFHKGLPCEGKTRCVYK